MSNLATEAPLPPSGDFRQLYDDHHAFVWRALYHFGLTPPALEDALQDVFVVVHRRLAAFDGRASFRSWLFGIARRVASTAVRSEKRAIRRADVFQIHCDEPAADERLAMKQAVTFVETFTATLSPGMLDVFLLSEIEGWTAPEIATALQVKLGTVYSRVHRVREDLARAAADHEIVRKFPHRSHDGL